MARVLIIAQHEDGTLNPATAKTLKGALDLGIDEIDVAVFGENVEDVAGQAAKLEGVKKVLRIEHADFAHPTAARIAPEIKALADDYSHILGPSTTFGKDVLPRAAALIGVAAERGKLLGGLLGLGHLLGEVRTQARKLGDVDLDSGELHLRQHARHGPLQRLVDGGQARRRERGL